MTSVRRMEKVGGQERKGWKQGGQLELSLYDLGKLPDFSELWVLSSNNKNSKE